MPVNAAGVAVCHTCLGKGWVWQWSTYGDYYEKCCDSCEGETLESARLLADLNQPLPEAFYIDRNGEFQFK